MVNGCDGGSGGEGCGSWTGGLAVMMRELLLRSRQLFLCLLPYNTLDIGELRKERHKDIAIAGFYVARSFT